MNNAGFVAVNDTTTLDMLCTAVVELQNALVEMRRIHKKRDLYNKSRIRELRGEVKALRDSARVAQLAAANGDRTPAAAKGTKRRAEDESLTPPPAPKKRRIVSTLRVSFEHYQYFLNIFA